MRRASARRLTEIGIARCKPVPDRRIELFDGAGGIPGFGVRVTDRGTKTFFLMYRLDGKLRRMTLGQHPVTTLTAARQAARRALQEVDRGVDPASAHREARRQRERDSVEAVLSEYVQRYLRGHARRHADIEAMLRRELVRHAGWGARPMQSISRRDVLDLLDGIVDRGSPISANRTLTYTRRFFRWALERGVLDADPLAGVRKPSPERPRDRALDEREIRALWSAWSEMAHPFGTIGKLLLLTAQRRGEVAAMRWADLDPERALWRLPAASTKAGREHVLPLSEPALKLLATTPRIERSPLVFPAHRQASTAPVSGFSRALETARRLSSVEAWTWHDLRRTAATFMARLNVPPHVVERILNHTAGSMGPIARIYNVHSYQAEMRAALEAWSRHVERITSGTEATVVPLRRAD